jgi:dihydrodipicolinate synthase/N-acetylneuraminate lyase
VYSTDWREMKAHVTAVLNATKLPCILYNNPPAYKTDFLPAHIAELLRSTLISLRSKSHPLMWRRITALKVLTGNRLALGVGMDDALVKALLRAHNSGLLVWSTHFQQKR